MRKWLPHFAELIDRLSIHQLKEVFLSEHKDKYRSEMSDILHDIQQLIEDKDVKLTAEFIHCVVVLSQINAHIWYNESAARKGESQSLDKLRLTHSLNGIRNGIMNKILGLIGDVDRRDYKVDCIASDFESWRIGLLDS